ncbi:hypothetical protein [Elizabethkingia meningoseptica]|uniref:hypothetical protein n=1 Tax=Elizabethkingia meningoseptica TaxID=238 RepID=UPI00389139F6
MKTKYVKVPVSERLPINGKYIIGIKMEPQSTTNGKAFPENILLEEVPDHSEEMLSVLSEVMRFKHELRMIMSDKLQYPDNFLKALTDAEQLINKVKP